MKANISKIVGAALCLAGVNAYAGDEGGVIQFEIANEDRGVFADVFEPIFDPTVGENTSDGHLSWAWRISYTPNRTNPKWFRPIKEYLIWSSDDATVRSSSTLQQMAFMPDETRKNAGFKERPHAGFLAYEERLSLADPVSTHTQRVDTAAMTVGIVGPLSGAEAVHEIVHDWVGLSSTAWDELDNEPVINVSYEIAERFFLLKSHADENLEVMPHARVALGNAFTYGAVGGTMRVGGHLTKDNGAPRMGPLYNSNTYAQDGDYWAWNIFAGSEVRAMAHNIFLDGNTFTDNNLSVDSNTFVIDFQVGFEVGYGASRFTVTNLWRSEEFETQGDPDQLLKAAFSYAF